jgi:hypothetical protein
MITEMKNYKKKKKKFGLPCWSEKLQSIEADAVDTVRVGEDEKME